MTAGSQDTALRWVLRGLLADLAVRKVKLDQAIW
jgi:hypothetical protein